MPHTAAGPVTAGPGERLRERIAGYERRFRTLFEEYFDALAAGALDAPSFSRFTPECLALLRDLSLRGGKRMRVVLLNEAARLVTDEPVAGLDSAALSIELLQTHGLVHDDLIDDSATRRGGPSTYYAYREKFPHDRQAAIGLTVLAGDLALALSLRALLDAPLPLALRQAMVEVQTRAATDTFVGQIVDLERDFTPAVPDEDVLHGVADYKSARYSLLAPLRLGLLAAGAQPADYDDELRRYAQLVGICGQMRDDYLDLFGDTATLGKPTGTDLRDGKRSYTVAALLSAVADSGSSGNSGSDRAVVESALGDASGTPETVAAVREIAERLGVPDRLRADMRRHAEQASRVAAAWRPRWRDEAVTFFEQLPGWSIERTR
ncbi:geranylgeranyl diphosphate synthase, type I [Streptomyces sp. yr375]|uniref:polyprenyl synthetase family protein n=1 Tax=Streptomyces sp. yr375 TaxID=1761906 RepID=UPI0008C28E53|nr:polyprenyl synthetase family protein [Streptomyces sp. yr375]SES35223.1 geranylgeranyl diphosphate synthase, type I [Streptomyces sp. yr375]